MIDLILALGLLILGLVLLVAEDVLPTSGVLGVLAVACFGFVAFLGFSSSTGLGLRYLVAELVLVPVTYGLSTYLIGRTGLAKAAYLRPPESHEVDLSTEGPELDRLVGRHGRAVTPLRPSGIVEFDGSRLDGAAEEGLIPAGALVLAVRVRSGRLIVRRERDQETLLRDE